MNKNNSTMLAERVKRIKPSPTLSIAAKATELKAAGKDIISLSVGEPDFDTPEHIKDAAIKAIQQGLTKYTPVEGTKSLRQAVIAKFARENQLHYELNQILVSTGAKQSLYNAFAAILNPGDEVIIPAPFWVSYPDMVLLADGIPRIVETEFKHQFKITPAQLDAAITPKTRALIVNSPSNPTGIAYAEAELKALGDVLLRHPQVIVITDDIYEHSLWAHKPFKTILNACPTLYDRTIVVNGVSKAYAMTGWRIGYAAGPEAIINAMKNVQSQSTSNPTSISQYAAEAALNGDQSCIDMMVKAYKERHDYVLNELHSMQGVECTPSDGTFYLFPSVTGLLNKKPEIRDDLALSAYLLDEAGLAVVPGSAFGAPGHIRLSIATSMDNLKEAMRRMKEVLRF